MKRLTKDGDPVNGIVKIDPVKALRNGFCLTAGVVGIIYFFSLNALLISAAVALSSMYVGVVAYHRLLIHRSFQCPLWVEYLLVFTANFSGMGSPTGLLRIHETRDWAQRKPQCHPYFAHRENIFIDGWQQLFCKLKLQTAPEFDFETTRDPFYRHLDRFWFLYQIPLGIALYYLAGWGAVFGGVIFKMFALQFGHWFVAHCLHNYGEQPVINKDAGVQGFNIPLLALLTFGESYHNNHHLCPEAARNSFKEGEIDPAWWLILLLKKMHLAGNVHLYRSN